MIPAFLRKAWPPVDRQLRQPNPLVFLAALAFWTIVLWGIPRLLGA